MNKIESLKKQLHDAYNEYFSTLPWIVDAVSKVGDSNDFRWSEQGEIDVYMHCPSLSDIADDAREYFEEYLADSYCTQVDWDNDALYQSNGPSLVINDDGDVYDQDSQKVVIKRNDYANELERNEQIEKYMDKTGCYPNVFRSDRHSNIFLVNTKEK